MNRLGPSDAAVFETYVAPRYMALFAEPMLEMFVPGREARVCHLACRTGYPDALVHERLPNAHIYGFDASEHAIEVAKAKARALSGAISDYRVAREFPTPFADGAFSHAFTLHLPVTHEERASVLGEIGRIVAPSGQALVAMPLRGSFFEIADLLRECALKRELPKLAEAIDFAMATRPTEDLFARELSAAGFDTVDVTARKRTLMFATGRELFEDPTTRLMLLPEWRASLTVDHLEAALAYVREAVDKYFRDDELELTVEVGVASGRRAAS